MADKIEHYKNEISLARTEIKNLRQQLISLKYEHYKEIKLIKAALNDLRCSTCAEAATTVAERRVEVEECSSNLQYRPIGYIETSFHNKRGVPRQPVLMMNGRGTVVIETSMLNNPDHALSGLEEFSHMWIIFHFHMTESNSVSAKVAPPRLGGVRQGVFSTRSPHRPCPIGLSLVKIHSIEGNKIHFYGVDMVNGTPVLDVKPYIPQYDYPFEASSFVRPPTEGVGDVAEDMANINIGDQRFDVGGISPRITTPIGIDTDSPCRTPFEDRSSSDSRQSIHTPSSHFPDSPSSIDLTDGNLRSPMRRPDAERGDPDGQERFTPPQLANQNIRHDGIRVAAWINTPAPRYNVRFTDDALARLHALIGSRAETFKTNIESLLTEDPRSNYVKTKYPDHEYNCVLEDLSISCVFDVSALVCNIVAVRNAEELQEN